MPSFVMNLQVRLINISSKNECPNKKKNHKHFFEIFSHEVGWLKAS